MIITQMFFDAKVFHAFVAACRAVGIPKSCKIVPGIMLLQAYGGFTRMTKFCKVSRSTFALFVVVVSLL